MSLRAAQRRSRLNACRGRLLRVARSDVWANSLRERHCVRDSWGPVDFGKTGHSQDTWVAVYAQCHCGRTSPHISRIKGRTDDMRVVRGIYALDAHRFVLQPHDTGVCCMEIDRLQMAKAEDVAKAAGFTVLEDEELSGL